MKKDNDVIFTCFGFVLYFVVLLIVTAFVRGFVLSTLWDWFVVFNFGVNSISVPVAIGLSLLIGMFTSASSDNNEKYKDMSATEKIILGSVVAVFSPLFVLFMAWIVKSFL